MIAAHPHCHPVTPGCLEDAGGSATGASTIVQEGQPMETTTDYRHPGYLAACAVDAILTLEGRGGLAVVPLSSADSVAGMRRKDIECEAENLLEIARLMEANGIDELPEATDNEEGDPA